MITAERPLAYMVALDLAGRRCAVIGGNDIAAQRVAGLLDAGALVTVIAAEIEPRLRALADRGDVSWWARPYRAGDLHGAFLAINAGADPAIEAEVHDEARREGVLLNTVDRPAACDYATPALVRRGRLQVAVSTSGDSPHVAATVRRRIEREVGAEWGTLLALVARVRRRLRHEGVDASHQRRVYAALTHDDVLTALRGDRDGETFARLLDGATTMPPGGHVHVVGAGPGDPQLLTIRVRDLLLDAEVVFHDALVSPGILALCGAGAELIDVGKRGGGRRTAQADITARLITAARSGAAVVRLKGGDPFLFGRGGEEVAALRAAGVAVEVVPGVSAALAAPAAAGIPVTMRGVSASVAVISGHDVRGVPPDRLERIARAVDTLVVLMPMHTLDRLSARLVAVLGAGRPAALSADATTADQRVVRAPLGDIAAAARTSGISAPATLVLGQVVDALPGSATDRPCVGDGAGARVQVVSRNDAVPATPA
ncbi:MAG: siroheme synthase CysG [Candidatus Dormibacteria bacterium]